MSKDFSVEHLVKWIIAEIPRDEILRANDRLT
jgi:hypothetical protein